jgi:hypothetical protein
MRALSRGQIVFVYSCAFALSSSLTAASMALAFEGLDPPESKKPIAALDPPAPKSEVPPVRGGSCSCFLSGFTVTLTTGCIFDTSPTPPTLTCGGSPVAGVTVSIETTADGQIAVYSFSNNLYIPGTESVSAFGTRPMRIEAFGTICINGVLQAPPGNLGGGQKGSGGPNKPGARAAGEQGAAGTAGVNGANGTGGAGGMAGLTVGTAGTKGLKGIKGDDLGAGGFGGPAPYTPGTDGFPGADNATDGTDGTLGTDGTAGTIGINGTAGGLGTNGTAGTNGTFGFDGFSGISGFPGSGGSPGFGATRHGAARWRRFWLLGVGAPVGGNGGADLADSGWRLLARRSGAAGTAGATAEQARPWYARGRRWWTAVSQPARERGSEQKGTDGADGIRAEMARRAS